MFGTALLMVLTACIADYFHRLSIFDTVDLYNSQVDTNGTITIRRIAYATRELVDITWRPLALRFLPVYGGTVIGGTQKRSSNITSVVGSEKEMSNSENIEDIGADVILALKEKGNTLFADGNYDEAIEKYGEAIAKYDDLQTGDTKNLGEKISKTDIGNLYCNRALCYFKNGLFVPSREDANTALKFADLSNLIAFKAHWRLAEIAKCLGKNEESIKEYKITVGIKRTEKVLRALREVEHESNTANDMLRAFCKVAPYQKTDTQKKAVTPLAPMNPYAAAFSADNVVLSMDDNFRKQHEPKIFDVINESETKRSDFFFGRVLNFLFSKIESDEKWVLNSNPTVLNSAGDVFSTETMLKLYEYLGSILLKEETCIELEMKNTETEKMFIVGDLHGSIRDAKYIALNVLYKVANTPGYRVIFMGDYIDRGVYGHHIICLLLTFKAFFPDKVVLMRANHESRSLTMYFGYQSQVQTLYTNTFDVVYNGIHRIFSMLPLSVVINKDIVCLHGGIPFYAFETLGIKEENGKYVQTLPEVINSHIPRDKRPFLNNGEVPEDFSELIWSDPYNGEQQVWMSPRPSTPSTAVIPNNHYKPSHRGVAYLYDRFKFQEFADKTNIRTVFRAHEVVDLGFRRDFHDDPLDTSRENGEKEHYTIFTSSKYVGAMENIGSYAVIDGIYANNGKSRVQRCYNTTLNN